MHVLDDLAEFSDRAQDLLTRTGRRAAVIASAMPTDFRRVPDRYGRMIPAPMELVIRREGFRARYGGLRYEVRRSVLIGQERYDIVRRWDYDLDDGIWADQRGWYFSWLGEHVSSPVRFLIHTDGRVGVSDGGPFMEVVPTVSHWIESHAVMDTVSSWDPWPGSLEPWTPSEAGVAAAARIEGLAVVAEASGRYDTWLLSDDVAVHSRRGWTSQGPRPHAVQIWTRGDEGRRRMQGCFPGALKPSAALYTAPAMPDRRG